MDANLLVFGYLFLRLAPFILACFFTLASLFNSDYKGIIYLGGLIITSVVTMMVSKIPPVNMLPHLDNSPEICRLFSLAQTDDLSALPLGQAMLTFTFGYLLYPLRKNNLVTANIPTIIFFSLLIFFDFIWNLYTSCYLIWQLILSAVIGTLGGIFWAKIISNNGRNSRHLYFTSLSEKETCSKPSKSTFKCTVYKNGEKLISKNIGG